jgi:hypothetical protein
VDDVTLEKTSEAIRAAFARGDVASAMEYHHPEVVKALTFHKCLKGRDAVAADLRATLQEFALEFVENQVESLLPRATLRLNKPCLRLGVLQKEEAPPFCSKAGRWSFIYATKTVQRAGPQFAS